MSSKLALCFLITRNIRNQKVWEKWWEGHEDKFSIYVHYSNSSKDNVTAPLLKQNRVRPIKTRWGDISLVNAEKQLYKKAFTDKRNKFFILLSDTCIPVREFMYVYRRLMSNPKKGIAPYRRIHSYHAKDTAEDFMPFVNTDVCINKMRLADLLGHDLYACDQWKVFSRKNVQDFLRMFDNKTFVKIFSSCIYLIPESLAPDELMFINYLAYKYKNKGGIKSQLRNRVVTYVDFKGKAIHPLTYKTITADLSYEICSANAMFARKFKRHNPVLIEKVPLNCSKK